MQDLDLEIDGALAWIYLNNVKMRNAFTTPMIENLCSTLKILDLDEKIKVVILSSRGDQFCAGGDIKAMLDKTGMFAGDSAELKSRYQNGIQQIPLAIEKFSKPLIAMIQGAAVGAGCDLATMCDLRIGSEKTKFAETFTKLALVPGDGGTFFLQRVVGYARAMEMFLTGDFYSAEWAHEHGLLNYLVPASDLLAKTKELAKKIADNDTLALKLTKRALKDVKRFSLDSHLEMLASFQAITQRTPEHFERVKNLLK
jgi:enoyl-CoA hydratase/carnithine racemase